ncbi:hypothetical protein P879_03529 [Paragonimus westermani]|uniref:Protein kinase domain-containing protein n=1 Tax=Paragonimus westermani TaxID=34504 RepID=A0A8T0DN17_9TREM|nr:hypothetical protein P879_03529 [Paragonimus westermani]
MAFYTMYNSYCVFVTFLVFPFQDLMDTVLTKLKSKVSTVLPGNPLTREYELCKHIGFAGPGMLWKLFAAKKRSTQQEATVWAFEKKTLDSYPKVQKESMIDILKYGVATLTRIKHPKILSVLQPLEESRESLAFASEPLFTSLKSALLTSFSNENKSHVDEPFVLTEVEIKYGLMQISEALSFLHTDCHRVHLNLVPESIVINKFGLWKFGGFEFSKLLEHQPSSASLEPTASVPIWQSSVMPACQPTLHASSPESIFEGQVTAASDMFSLGLLICCLYNQGQSLFDRQNDYSAYRKAVKEMTSICATKISRLPENLKEYVKLMLSADPALRPSALQFSRTPYFEDASMSVLRSIDNMYQLDNLARSQFYKSLPSAIHTLPRRLCLFRVFPQITEDFSNPHMVPFILPAVLQVIDMVTQEEFVQHMLPRLLPIMSLKEPVQIMLVLLQNLRVLSEKFPTNEFRLYVLPILHSALDTDNKMIQELCLKSLPSICSFMELSMLRNAVLPRIQKLFFRTDLLSTRIACLMCMGKLLDHLDKWIVMDELLPFLQQITSREPIILIAMLGIYRIAFSHEKLGISREKLATRVLPHLIPLSVDSSLNLKQYNAFAELIRDMCNQLEREQRSKLEQLHGVQEDSSLVSFSVITNGCSQINSCADLMDRIMRTHADSHMGIFENHTPPKELSTSNTQSTDRMSANNKSAPLTIEQKRQLAAERCQHGRLQNQRSLDTLQPTKRVTSSKPVPRDLTSTLVESNLTALANNINLTQQRTFQPGLPLSLVRAPSTPMNYLSYPHYSAGSGLPLCSTVTPPSTGISCTSAMWDPYRNPNTFGPMNTAPLGSNVPMSAPRFSVPASNFCAPQSGQIKPLSKTDIDDLLS